MSTKKRIAPTAKTLEWRSGYLCDLRGLKPAAPTSPTDIKLSLGNTKTGQNGDLYKTTLVWNLPSLVTCPGASEWCLRHCYNADNRIEKFPIDRWVENWWMSIFDKSTLYESISEQLKLSEKPCAVRIHSSGDFYSSEYIEFWYQIALDNQNVKFWAYTRSWNDETMSEAMSGLRRLENFQLFASYDSTMDKERLPKWRKSLVVYSEEEAKDFIETNSNSVICPEQIGKVSNCASCGICINNSSVNVIFLFH